MKNANDQNFFKFVGEDKGLYGKSKLFLYLLNKKHSCYST